jgi:putative intracellular protease/amidase
MRQSMRFTYCCFLASLVIDGKISLAAPPVAPTPVVRSGQLSEGTRWATPWFEIDSGVDGPVLMVTGGVHGNEPAGYRAAEQIRHWPICRGRLIVVPRVNKLGLAANQRWLPTFRDDKTLRDPNRNFPQQGQPNKANTIPCQALWQLAQRQKPTWVVDLHEGFDFHVANPKSVGSSLIYVGSKQTDSFAMQMQDAVNRGIGDASRRLVLLDRKGPVQGSFVRSAIDHFGCSGFILETTFKGQPLSLRVRQHRVMVSTLMQQLGMIDKSCVDTLAPMRHPEKLPNGKPGGTVRHVGLYDAIGTGGSGAKTLTRIFDRDPRFVVHRLGPRDLQNIKLDQFSLIIFPGGSGSRQAKAIGPEARERVRTFVRNGGGYLGICAGAYLCSAHYDWSLNLVDTKVFTGAREIPNVGRKQMWYRGRSATVKIELTDEGRKILGDWPGLQDVRYHNGPIVSVAGRRDLATFLPLAYFRTEVAAWPPQLGTMVNSPAIVASSFGQGRVIAISPHAESSGKISSIINHAAYWLCAMDEKANREQPAVRSPAEKTK